MIGHGKPTGDLSEVKPSPCPCAGPLPGPIPSPCPCASPSPSPDPPSTSRSRGKIFPPADTINFPPPLRLPPPLIFPPPVAAAVLLLLLLLLLLWCLDDRKGLVKRLEGMCSGMVEGSPRRRRTAIGRWRALCDVWG